ncbi:MAG TPA: D-2-hydroxyacid dehydrogenase [Oscillospiraceae bacterium]|nr:D-2-hydroxyacid dehydrogenase [Oscillospiraceae bacterium]HPS34199.1 D-2-hydroxyacid dehydrogenase [Oscillospiraceae bacterium]
MKISLFDKCTLTVGDVDFSAIEALGDVTFHDIVPPKDLAETIGDADIVLVNKAVLTGEIFAQCKNIKYVGLFATGYNNIDLEAARRHGITVCNAPGYSTDSVTQHVFALLLQIAGSIGQYDRSVHNGDWVRSLAFSYFPYPITEIKDKTLGIFGYGSIGKSVAKAADAFGMKVIVCTRTKPENCPYELVSKEELFARSDYLTIHSPLTPQTKELVNKDTLALMKPTAVLINTSRGGVVNEPELADALNSGKIAAAGLDVLTVEPMKADNPLLSAKNCVITPHTAWASKEARQRLIGLVASNMKAFLDGKPVNVVS